MVKKPSLQAVSKAAVTPEQAEALAARLADKPYGEDKPIEQQLAAVEALSRTTISLPTSLLRTVEDQALRNKREGKDLRNVSAIVREALKQYFS